MNIDYDKEYMFLEDDAFLNYRKPLYKLGLCNDQGFAKKLYQVRRKLGESLNIAEFNRTESNKNQAKFKAGQGGGDPATMKVPLDDQYRKEFILLDQKSKSHIMEKDKSNYSHDQFTHIKITKIHSHDYRKK
jgi:hypothetical protein